MTTWKTTAPTEPGLYVARAATRRGGHNPALFSRGLYVRHWSGKRWSPPTAVDDLHLAGRVPDASWPVARDEAGRVGRVEWLEPFALPAELNRRSSQNDNPAHQRYWCSTDREINLDTIPLIERLQAAAAILDEVQELATRLPEFHEDAAPMALHMVLVKSYLSELALNLARGKDVYDAVLTTARGQTPINKPAA